MVKPNEVPKLIALVVAIVLVAGFIVFRFTSATKDTRVAANEPNVRASASRTESRRESSNEEERGFSTLTEFAVPDYSGIDPFRPLTGQPSQFYDELTEPRPPVVASNNNNSNSGPRVSTQVTGNVPMDTERVPEKLFVLKGVVSGEAAIAVIEIDGRRVHVREGEMIAGLVTVTQIRSSGINVRTKTGSMHLALGETGSTSGMRGASIAAAQPTTPPVDVTVPEPEVELTTTPPATPVIEQKVDTTPIPVYGPF